MQEVFGEERVGLHTGDMNINMGAPVMIMTTEILRNIGYRTQLKQQEVNPYGKDEDLSDVGLAVLDEVHYLGHPDRGSVWEELVINTPSHIQLLAMSATVANPAEIGAWIESVHGPCATIQTSWRPVPLDWWFASDDADGHQGPSTLLPLMETTQVPDADAAGALPWYRRSRVNPALQVESRTKVRFDCCGPIQTAAAWVIKAQTTS